MKTLSEDALAKLAGRDPIIAGAAKFVFPSGVYRFWSGYGRLNWGEGEFLGTGARALIAPIETSIGGAADGLTIRLSALDPDIAQSIEQEDYHQKPVTIYRLIFADLSTLLAAPVFLRGRVDIIPISETIGADASLGINIEGPRRDMGRAGARIRSDADQRTLGGGADGGMRHISISGRKVLSWGQKEAPASEATNGRRVPTFYGGVWTGLGMR
jgi:hypothetical protein